MFIKTTWGLRCPFFIPILKFVDVLRIILFIVFLNWNCRSIRIPTTFKFFLILNIMSFYLIASTASRKSRCSIVFKSVFHILMFLWWWRFTFPWILAILAVSDWFWNFIDWGTIFIFIISFLFLNLLGILIFNLLFMIFIILDWILIFNLMCISTSHINIDCWILIQITRAKLSPHFLFKLIC